MILLRVAATDLVSSFMAASFRGRILDPSPGLRTEWESLVLGNPRVGWLTDRRMTVCHFLAHGAWDTHRGTRHETAARENSPRTRRNDRTLPPGCLRFRLRLPGTENPE